MNVKYAVPERKTKQNEVTGVVIANECRGESCNVCPKLICRN